MGTQMNKRHPNRSRNSMVILIVIFAVLALFIAAMIIGVLSFLKFYKPTLDTDVPFTEDSEITDGTADIGADTTDVGGDKYTRNTDVVNFLVIGQDLASWKTDVMMLVNFNMEKGSLNILQIPRDTYVNAEDVRGKINNLMYKKSKAAYEEKNNPSVNERVMAGMEGAVEFLEEKLCVQIDGYALVNLEGFRNVVDIIGGVSLNVPADMKYDDPDQNLYIDLKAGPQVLYGKEAEMFVRFRSEYIQGDIGRGNAQKIFLAALFKELVSSINISTVPKLVGEAVKHVTTDLDAAEIVFYVKELMGVDMENMTMMTLPGDAPNNSHYVMRRADVLTIVNNYFNVYDKPVTEEMFDAGRNFTDSSDERYNAVYNSPATEFDIYTAAGIDSEGIYIPRTQHKPVSAETTAMPEAQTATR